MSSVQYREARERVRVAMEEARALAKQVFADEAQSKLEEHQIESFGWVQYTPYFNDGDECIFGVRADLDYGLEVNGERWEDAFNFIRDEPDSRTNWSGHYEPADENTKPKEVWDDLRDFVYSFDEDDLKHAFGDHVKVTVTRNGATTQYYEHD